MNSSASGNPAGNSLRGSVTAAHVVPFAAFLAFLPIPSFFPGYNPEFPWWKNHPEHWLYPIQCAVCLALLFYWRKHYQFRPARGLLFGAVIGIAAIAIWIIPTAWHAATGLGGDGHWLSWLGFQKRTDGFDPSLFDRQSNPVGSILTLALRFLRLVIVVPLIEEIFWRGFLMRWLIDSGKPWHRLPIGSFAWKSFLFTTLMVGLAHGGPDLTVALIYGALAGWVTIRTGSLTAVILMHAVANLLLGIYVMATGHWGLW